MGRRSLGVIKRCLKILAYLENSIGNIYVTIYINKHDNSRVIAEISLFNLCKAVLVSH